MQNPGRKATITDIARLAGASPSTVSAALNGSWKARRISEAKVEAIRKVAQDQGYSINMQARGLRQGRSGLVGMIIPIHNNRYFSSMSQSFEAEARERGLVPVIASSMRKAEEELRIVESLISYAVDGIFIAGASDPEAITRHCVAAGVRHVFVDLPGKGASSVISDNYQGAAALTQRLLADCAERGDNNPDRVYFLGGIASNYATSRRIEAFRDVMIAQFGRVDDQQILACSYSPRRAREEISRLMDRLGGLPSALFVNSLTSLEGVLAHFVHLPHQAFENHAIGCYDYDPFAAFLQFPMHMVRQDSHSLILQAYALMDAPAADPVVIEVSPQLIPPRTIYNGPFGELG
jgi:LacI family transcriptional regulator, fructose operon transcriptional repressor